MTPFQLPCFSSDCFKVYGGVILRVLINSLEKTSSHVLTQISPNYIFGLLLMFWPRFHAFTSVMFRLILYSAFIFMSWPQNMKTRLNS